MNSFIQYLKDVRGELTHVTWPSQRQTIIFTIITIVLTIVTAVYLGALDYLFSTGLDRFVL